ncbi:acetyltransferase, GNAT family [Novosphingobium sp. Rr 2-17]|nr:acetyltransferase, GNAT family [Novosphingobium sp. Rr 2-17]
MEAEIRIRAERSDDAPTISDVVLRAYANVPYSNHREQLMIEQPRGTDAYSPTLSLLAEIGDEVVGHVLLTKAQIVGAQSSVTTMALARM